MTKYYAVSKNRIAHTVKTGNKKAFCGVAVKPEWAKYTQTNDSKCEKCHACKEEMKNV